MVERICQFCSKKFPAREQDVARGFSFYCRRQCYYDHVKSGSRPRPTKPKVPNVKCAYCANEFYLPASKFKSKHGYKFCCREHKDLAQRLGGIKEIQPPHYCDGGNHYRAIAFRQRPKSCERCGYDKHPAAIVVHHKDRDRENNDITNLEVLCANCHAIEHYSL